MKILEEPVYLKLIQQSAKVILAYYTLCYFQYFLQINIGIATYFIYYKYLNHNEKNVSKYDYVYQRKNY